MRYGVFSDYDDYSADTRNTNPGIVLWRIRSSDYAADTRNSNAVKTCGRDGFFSDQTECAPPPPNARTIYHFLDGLMDRPFITNHSKCRFRMAKKNETIASNRYIRPTLRCLSCLPWI